MILPVDAAVASHRPVVLRENREDRQSRLGLRQGLFLGKQHKRYLLAVFVLIRMGVVR